MSAHAGYVLAIAVSSVVTAAVAGWLWRSHTSRLSRLFASVLVVHPVIGILVLGQVFAPTQSLMELLLVAMYAVATPVAGLWFVTALAFANREDPLTKRFLLPVGGFYAVLVGLIVTNPVHLDFKVETPCFSGGRKPRRWETTGVR